LKWAEGVIPSVAGNISVKLKKLIKGDTETGMQINVVVPENTSAKIYVPVQPGKGFTIHSNNNLIWKEGKFIETNENISFDSRSYEFIVFEFQSGTYTINAVNAAISKF